MDDCKWNITLPNAQHLKLGKARAKGEKLEAIKRCKEKFDGSDWNIKDMQRKDTEKSMKLQNKPFVLLNTWKWSKEVAENERK